MTGDVEKAEALAEEYKDKCRHLRRELDMAELNFKLMAFVAAMMTIALMVHTCIN